MRKLLIFISGAMLSLTVFAEALDYAVQEGRFYTSEGEIPAGCFARLRSELNGDNVVHSIYLNRANLRGCIAANYSYPGDGADISYTIKKELPEDTYHLSVCERLDSGSMGQYCDNIIVQFKNKEYITPDGVQSVLVLEKTGEW